MFYIENSLPAELEASMDELIKIIENEEAESLKILANWFNGYLKHIAKKHDAIDTNALYDQITSPMEVRQMFATKLKEYEETLLTKGKIEGKIEAARRMIDEGLSDDLIKRITGLSQDEIEALRSKKNWSPRTNERKGQPLDEYSGMNPFGDGSAAVQK